MNESSIPDNVSTTTDLDLTTLEGNETIKLSSIYTGTFEAERYGLRADGKFYCDPSSTIGRYKFWTGYWPERGQIGIIYDSSHFLRNDNGTIYYNDDDGSAVGTIFYVWDDDGVWPSGVDIWDVFDEEGQFLRSENNY